MRVVIQAHQRLVLDGLAHALDQEPDIDVVGAHPTTTELIASVKRLRPEAALIEVGGHAHTDLHRLVRVLRHSKRSLRLYGLQRDSNRIDVHLAQRLGIRPVLSWADGVDKIIEAVRSPKVPSEGVAPIMSISQARPRRVADLTARQLEVLLLLAAGGTASSISRALDISPKTVEGHKQRLFSKLGAESQAHAVVIALRSGAMRPSQYFSVPRLPQ